jgi:hypothetical protein
MSSLVFIFSIHLLLFVAKILARVYKYSFLNPLQVALVEASAGEGIFIRQRPRLFECIFKINSEFKAMLWI